MYEKVQERAYRIYVSDALKILTENTARYAGGNQLNVRYADLDKEKDNRSAAEIVNEVLSKAGVEVI